MKSVLISIQPRWCSKIIDGEKTIEVRKSKPKLDIPFKVYIYCSAGSYEWSRDPWTTDYFTPSGECTNMSQMVIGEFVCDKIITVDCDSVAPFNPETHGYIQAETCLDRAAFIQYTNFRKAFGWHISDLKIYDKPRELGEFRHCGVNYHFAPIITRPPQSWCYVEELKNEI